MSERVGSDIERLRILNHAISIDLEKFIIQFQSRSMSDPTLSDIDFKNEMAWVWSPDSGLPLKFSNPRLDRKIN